MAKNAQAIKPTFASVLDMPSSEVERIAKPLPVGSYLAVVVGQPKIDKSSKKQTEYSEYTMKILQAYDDVDEDALEEYLTGMDGKTKKLTDCTIRNTYYHTENSIGRLATFFDHLDGITPDKAGEVDESLRMGEVPGKQCIIHIKHEPFQSGEGVRAVVASTSIAE